MPGLTTEAKGFYKPFQFPWAFEAYVLQQKMHWLPEEVPLHDDVKDWRLKLKNSDRNQLSQLFRFFTTGDVDVGQAYIDKFMQVFKNEEIRMMLGAFTNMESVHAHAYSLLLDTVGMPEVEYQAFRKYEAMAAKHDYLTEFTITDERSVARALAVYSGFTEGLQLFSTFAILMNFSRFNKMKGMGQIVTWSIRDESLHVESMLKLFHAYCDERPGLFDDALKAEISAICLKMVELEDTFIDLAFELGDSEGLTKADVKRYIRYIANLRLEALGVPPLFEEKTNPLEWLDWLLNGVEVANFFEARATTYAKASASGSWDDVWAQPDDSTLVHYEDTLGARPGHYVGEEPVPVRQPFPEDLALPLK